MLYDFWEGEASSPSQVPLVQLVALGSLADECLSSLRQRERWQLSCPACGDTHLHLVGTGTHQGDVVTILAGDGTHIIRDIDADPDGDAVLTITACENCHLFIAERVRERKGHLYRSRIAFASESLAAAARISGGRF